MRLDKDGGNRTIAFPVTVALPRDDTLSDEKNLCRGERNDEVNMNRSKARNF